MAIIRRKPWYARPWHVFALGLIASVVGTVSTYLIPSSRQAGLTPLVLLQCLLIFGGMGMLLISLAVHESQGERDTAAGMRLGTRYVLSLVGLMAVFALLDVPFGSILAFALANRFSELLRRACAWLGRE